jgi:1-acyl-sn-glycerol-3-phosphate acyltransferase
VGVEVKRRIAKVFLRATGWRAEGRRPAAGRCVVDAAPHTSNWDLLFLLAFAWRFDVRMRFMMKHTVFVGPAGWLFRRLGGIAIRRGGSGGVVKQMADAFEATDELALVVPPEGTRSRVDVWKSGFYHIARKADVPVVLSFLDFGRKVGGFGPGFHLSGNVREDMGLVRDFYSDKVPLRPECFGEIRLVEEGPAEPV